MRSSEMEGEPGRSAAGGLVEELLPPPDVAAALAAVADQPDVILLESRLDREGVSRYSFLVADPFEFVEIARPVFGEDPFARLRDCSARFVAEPLPDLPPFQGGAVGMLGYELGGAWERVPLPDGDEFAMPALAVGIYDWVVAWDHLQQRAWIVSQGFPETDPRRRARRAERRLADVREALAADSPAAPTAAAALTALTAPETGAVPRRGAGQEPAARFPAEGPGGLVSDFSRPDYLAAVERVIDYIHAGDVFQVNLSQRLLYPQPVPALELYGKLRQCNPAPFAGYVAHDDWTLLSASPERFVALRDGWVETRPIKGTRPRRGEPEAALFLKGDLHESEKDRAENVMIVDLLRNDLSRVCRPGSVTVPTLCGMEIYETVLHLVSEIRGELQEGLGAWDLLAAVFPGGSITGAPKVRAMEIIAELEPTARGPYCGSLFYVGFDGAMDSSILIRTFVLRDGWVQCSVGGGIVAGSDPSAEFKETMDKAAGMLRAF